MPSCAQGNAQVNGRSIGGSAEHSAVQAPYGQQQQAQAPYRQQTTDNRQSQYYAPQHMMGPLLHRLLDAKRAYDDSKVAVHELAASGVLTSAQAEKKPRLDQEPLETAKDPGHQEVMVEEVGR